MQTVTGAGEAMVGALKILTTNISGVIDSFPGAHGTIIFIDNMCQAVCQSLYKLAFIS